jgi:class 3 adenylate cyclase
LDAERRQVTVLFTDMVGFTSFSERSGEEAAFTLMRSLSKLMDDAVREQGGAVRNFTGDGIMAVFGAPVAFEDSPLRACRAALNILQRLKAAGPNLEAKHGVHPQLRIGLNTGPAVVGKVEDSADAGVTVLGDTVNFAARLQSLAEPNSAFMSDATHRLVEGLVAASFAGQHRIKGKSEPQLAYRLEAIRQGATRFDAAVSRGLSTFVGREREFVVLERALDEARSQFRVVDLVAEPGMGKSRLLHEFRGRINKDRVRILSGSCSPDGQQTPFLPFIEVVRGSFGISTGEAEKDITQKLDLGLATLALQSNRNLGLLLHLLGLTVPDGALIGLDGVLIGLRTRELLQELLEAHCRLLPVVLMIEDLHWIDRVSEELLQKIVDRETEPRLLLLTTRRPEYPSPWFDRVTVTTLPLKPLPTGDICHLVQARLGVVTLPEALARQVTEKAEGNPLFAEEIVSFLTERGVLRAERGEFGFDAKAAVEIPASVQSLLTARVDRLPAKDRGLLQAAAAIGRRFDPQLLSAVVGEAEIDDGLNAMQAVDLVHFVSGSGECMFKHALVRDALYQSLLSEARTGLHLKIADEIERRSGNRLFEVAELLAYHYSQTDQSGKAFTYLGMAGAKCLGVYSLDEAEKHFTAAAEFLDRNSDCATDELVADFLSNYSQFLSLKPNYAQIVDTIDHNMLRLRRLGDRRECVPILHHYVFALIYMRRFRDAQEAQKPLSLMADYLVDDKSQAYALAGEIHVSTMLAPQSVEASEALTHRAKTAAFATSDAYIQSMVLWVIAWDEVHSGRMDKARITAHELIGIGQRLNDPRPTTIALWVLGWIAIMSDDYQEALHYGDECTKLALTQLDRLIGQGIKGVALILLRNVDEGATILDDQRAQCVARNWLYQLTGSDVPWGLSLVLKGRIAAGIRFINNAISARDCEGYRLVADWSGLFLCELFLEIIAEKKRPPLLILLKNLPILLKVIFTASSRIHALTARVFDNPQFDPEGHHIGRAQMILGLLYKAKKKRSLALRHLNEAKRILSQFGQTPILARVDAALAELGQ